MPRIRIPLLALAALAAVGRFAPAQEKPEKTVVEVAAGRPELSKLVTAIKSAALVEALSGDGPFTVFAPTDRAFEALGETALKAVLADEKKLKAVLTGHVVKGQVTAAEALVLAKYEKSVTALNGSEIKLSIKNGKLNLNGTTTVAAADVAARNGVIHVIDAVLLPAASPCVPVADPAAYTRAMKFDATPKDKQRLVELFRAAADVAPPKGDRAAWKRRNEGLVASAEEFAAVKEPAKVADARRKFAVNVNCVGCHLAHRDAAVAGFGDLQLCRIPDDIPAEFRKGPGNFDFPQPALPQPFPQPAFPKIEFPKMEFPQPGFPNPAFPNPFDPVERAVSAEEKRFGLATDDLSPALAEQLGLEVGAGRVVARVSPGSAAADGGLKATDIVLKLDGRAVPATAAGFAKALDRLKPGGVVEVTVLRKRKEQKLELKVPGE